MGFLALVRHPCASPLQLAGLLGHLTWVGLLSKPSLSAFTCVYDFINEGGEDVQDIPDDMLLELLTFIGLVPLLAVDLRMQWQDVIIATDASPAFGFGVSIAKAQPELHREVARYACQYGNYVQLGLPGKDIGAIQNRSGRRLELPLSKSARPPRL